MRVAYFDCFAGAGGDMIVAAMVDAGLDAGFLKGRLATLGIDKLDINLTKTTRAGLSAMAFVPAAAEQHKHRNIKQITEIINRSKIDSLAKKTAISIFNKLADAEAAVHGKDRNDVHFHEIGAIDSIIDIVAASVGLVGLGIEKVYCSALSVGGGTVKCEHGILPVPAPATAELVKNVPIVAGPAQMELLTPTAAAILTTITDEFSPLPAMAIESIGYGAGSFQCEQFPNVLQLFLGETTAADSENADCVCQLETNVDDVSGEVIGSVTQKLLCEGALDVFTTPIYMKNNRPAVQLSVICKIQDCEKLQQLLFEQGLTFGIRKQILQRSKLARQLVTVKTDFGEIRIKTGWLNGRIVNAKPELADCVKAAVEHNQPVKTVLDAAMTAYKAL